MKLLVLLLADSNCPICQPVSVQVFLWETDSVSIVIVIKVVTASVPANSLCLHLISWVDERSHAIIVKFIWLGQVVDIYANHCACFDIHDGEVVPLEESTVGICVILQIQVVLAVNLFSIVCYFFISLKEFFLRLLLLIIVTVAWILTLFLNFFFATFNYLKVRVGFTIDSILLILFLFFFLWVWIFVRLGSLPRARVLCLWTHA